jgi:exosortase/archaeosortase family protein
MNRLHIFNRAFLILSLQLIAFWAVWQWYVVRLYASPEERWGLVALVTAAICVLRKRSGAAHERTNESLFLVSAILLTLSYGVSYSHVLPLVRATLAMLAVACALGSVIGQRRGGTHVGVAGLLLLALPVVPSLQFYGGYPLRVLTGRVAAPLLQLSGFAVTAEGTCLNFGGQAIWIDAPCSGIRMLWVGLFLACTLVALYELRLLHALIALTGAGVVIVAGNIFRAVALFYVEAKIIEVPAWTHEATGVASFLFVAAGIVVFIEALRKGRAMWRCDSVSS